MASAVGIPDGDAYGSPQILGKTASSTEHKGTLRWDDAVDDIAVSLLRP